MQNSLDLFGRSHTRLPAKKAQYLGRERSNSNQGAPPRFLASVNDSQGLQLEVLSWDAACDHVCCWKSIWKCCKIIHMPCELWDNFSVKKVHG